MNHQPIPEGRGEPIYSADVSPGLISRVTYVVADEIIAWQARPLDSFYAILYIDALMVKVRDGGVVDSKAAYLVTGVDIDGFKHVLGIWLAASEGSRFWAGSWPSCATAASRTSCSCAATG